MPAARPSSPAAEADLQRFEALLEANAGSRKQRDDAARGVDVARERARGARAGCGPPSSGRRGSGPARGREEIDAARARVAAADAQIATLEKTLAATPRSIAPVAGIVTEKLVDVGEVVAPRAPLVVVTDLDHAWATVSCPSR